MVYFRDSTHSAADNCVAIYGWNNVAVDPSTSTTLTRSYVNGEVCFVGTIEPDGWGAVYNLTLANEETWDATAVDVEGMQLEATGSRLPPRVGIIYADANAVEFCQRITPAASVQVPFTSTHPDCSTNPATATPDPQQLTMLKVHFLIAAAAYDVDFCLRIRAIP